MERSARWDRITSTPLLIAALAFLAAYAIPILWPGLSNPGFEWVILVVWVLFAIDYLVRVLLAENRLRYVRTHLIDLAAIALPMLRPLRLLRVVTILSILNRRASVNLRGRVAAYLVGATMLLGFCAALAALDAERYAPDATITTFADAAWWTLTTMTTVGYGDCYPVTATGRWIGAGLMIGGIAILGTVTATIASWLVEHISEGSEVERLRAEIAELRRNRE
ncbi:ion transporter [Enemella evansiae]|uniref:potassium channel family protein n=1 Tax=Enemella evansiae TaxID=2016499 RepID=UPI000B968DE5|nr:potassium channel family protein [Enemella evansiae]OYO14986.1 ion transporter [Enemella evansiae]